MGSTAGAGKVLSALSRLRETDVEGELLPRYSWFPSSADSPAWWGGLASAEEIAISAVLVQLSRWDAALAALRALEAAGLGTLEALSRADPMDVEVLVRGVGMPSEKARRLISLARAAGGSMDDLCRSDGARDLLLGVRGIGRETADGVLLFGCNRMIWPASRMGVRVLSRVGVGVRGGYERWRAAVEGQLPRDLGSYKLMHAGLVTIARAYCRQSIRLCSGCPLRDMCDAAPGASAARVER